MKQKLRIRYKFTFSLSLFSSPNTTSLPLLLALAPPRWIEQRPGCSEMPSCPSRSRQQQPQCRCVKCWASQKGSQVPGTMGEGCQMALIHSFNNLAVPVNHVLGTQYTKMAPCPWGIHIWVGKKYMQINNIWIKPCRMRSKGCWEFLKQTAMKKPTTLSFWKQLHIHLFSPKCAMSCWPKIDC